MQPVRPVAPEFDPIGDDPIATPVRWPRHILAFEALLYLLKALLNSFREWGGAGVPNIAILDWEGLPTADERRR